MTIDHNMDIVECMAGQYDVSKDFDQYNTMLATRIILPYCFGKRVLEVGCATGEMTVELTEAAAELTVLEPSKLYCNIVAEKIADQKKHVPRFVNGFLSDMPEETPYDVVVLASLLHHLENPACFLAELKRLIHSGSEVLATVPNMTSLHRRIGAKAGLLSDMYGTTLRNNLFNQYGRFDLEQLEDLFCLSGFEVRESYGYMLKPFSSSQMMLLDLELPMIDALFELGKEFPALASQLFVRAAISKGAI